MAVSAPIRPGILGKLAKRLPRVDGRGLFKPNLTAFNFTNRCNATCEMCLEDGNKKRFQPYTVEEAAGILGQIAELNPWLARRYLHLWGGEPFLERDLLLGIVQEADRLRFGKIQIATNGYWGKDLASVRKILADLRGKVRSADLALQISGDKFHQSQEILSPGFLANIIFLAKTEYPEINISINSLLLNNFQSLHDLAGAISAIQPEKVWANFDEIESQEFCYSRISGCSASVENIPLNFSLPSLSGRCTPRLSSQFGCGPLQPEKLAKIDYSIENHLSIGIDRQMYINLLFSSPGILPMGNINEFSLRELVERTEADPIAVSLMRHGYSELYPHLSKLFDFDSWIRQFYSAYDILQGLEADEPRPLH
jgi:organic radical activating enzyme